MKNKKHILALFIAVLCFSMLACGSNHSHQLSENAIRVDPTERERILLSDFFDSVRYVKLETTDDILIGQISTIRYANNSIFILDSPRNTLFSFDATTGEHQWSIRNIGQGPGELTHITDFDVDGENDRLFLFSSMNRIQEFDLQGNFIDEFNIRLVGRSFAFAGNYMYVYAGNHPNIVKGQQRNYYLLIYNRKNSSLKGKIPFEDNPNLGMTRVFNHSNAFYRYSDRVRFFTPYFNRIYEIKGDEISIAHEFDFGRYNLPRNLSFFSWDDLRQANYVYGLHLAWENDRYLSFTVMKGNGNFLQILYSKDEGRLYSGYFFDDIGRASSIFVQATNNFVMGYHTMEHLFLVSDHRADEEDALIRRIAERVIVDDNPVVFFYYFRSR